MSCAVDMLFSHIMFYVHLTVSMNLNINAIAKVGKVAINRLDNVGKFYK